MNTSPITDPADWLPADGGELIGPAALIVRAVLAKAQRSSGTGFRLLLTGPPGCGKSTVNAILAAALAAHSSEIERISGKEVNADRVRDWIAESSMRSLFGGRGVKLIEELDKCTPDGAVLLLDYLDRIKSLGHRAVLASSNAGVSDMDSRLQSRFQHFPVSAPTANEIQRFLQARCNIPSSKARTLAEQCAGDFRAALNDAQSYLDVCRAMNQPIAA